VGAPAIGLPSGDAGREMLVRVRDAPIMLFLKFVLQRVGRGIAAQPELLDEIVALFVVRELLEGVALFIGDDPAHILIEPFLIGLAQLGLERFIVPLLLLFRDRSLQWIGGLCRGSFGG